MDLVEMGLGEFGGQRFLVNKTRFDHWSQVVAQGSEEEAAGAAGLIAL